MVEEGGEPNGEPLSPDTREWRVTEEFRHQLGCGLITAVGLPAWFAVMALALGRETSGLAVVVAVVLFAMSAVIGISAFRRLRVLPTTVALDADGWLRITGRHIALALPAEALTEVEIGASPGLESVHLNTRQGRTVRLPGDLNDLDGLLSALRQANPAVVVIDHRRSDGEGQSGEKRDDGGQGGGQGGGGTQGGGRTQGGGTGTASPTEPRRDADP
jgi:uncharacterized membrane protein YgcG